MNFMDALKLVYMYVSTCHQGHKTSMAKLDGVYKGYINIFVPITNPSANIGPLCFQSNTCSFIQSHIVLPSLLSRTAYKQT